jgi:hypothetical protein
MKGRWLLDLRGGRLGKAHKLNGVGCLHEKATRSPSGTWLGLECKNVREWLYPDRTEIRQTIDKCLRLDCVPMIIGRRIPYVTFRLPPTLRSHYPSNL